jgi:thiol-disulfide isomerase/thioredoxin
MSKPSPSRTTFRTRKLIAALVGGGLSLLLAAQFLALLKPAAAREIRAACNGLRPAVTNPALGTLPTAAEEFTAQAPSGEQVSLSDYRGEVVMLNFWASWCEVCKSEKPSLEALKEDLGREGLRVISVASDQDWEAVQEALGGALPHGTPLEVVLDPPEPGDNLGRIARAYGVGAVPETFLIDRQGNVRQYFINKRTWNSSVAKTCIRAFLNE